MKDKNPEEMNNSGDLIFGIAIRLSFSLRNQKTSSYALFFKKTLRRKTQHDITIFPTNFYDILDKQEQTQIESDPYLYKYLIKPYSSYFSRFVELDSANWIVIENLREIGLKDIQQYYVYGTNYSLADKMMEPAFPRIYYTNTEKHRFHKKRNFSFCPYCGHSLSEDFLYCPSCGSSLRIINNQ